MTNYYELKYKQADPDLDDFDTNYETDLLVTVQGVLADITKVTLIDYIWHQGLEFKWRDQDENMTELSKAFPFLLFTLDCRDSEGVYRYYYKDGKSQYTQGIMVFDECRL